MTTPTGTPFPGAPRRVTAVYRHPDGPIVQAVQYDHQGSGDCPHCPDASPHKHISPVSVEAP